MDIVRVKARRRASNRRHTMEVQFDELPSRQHTLSKLNRDSIMSLSSEDLLSRGDEFVADYPSSMLHTTQFNQKGAGSSHIQKTQLYKSPLTSSWGAVNRPLASSLEPSNSGSYFQGSQTDILGAMNELSCLPPRLGCRSLSMTGHQYQLSYELALDNVLTPFAPATPAAITPLALTSMAKTKKSHASQVVDEIVSTEASYVRDVGEVIEGYLMPLQARVNTLPLSNEQIHSLFGNIVEIREFHSALLQTFIDCGGNRVELGECFLHKAEDFKVLYTQYCNNYPKSIRVLTTLTKIPEVSNILKTCLQRLGHLLPLGAYLLKPVQRVLRYHLLLSQVVKNMQDTAEGWDVLQDAMSKMTEVAEHIDAMKRKYDTAVHVQEIQSLIRGHEMQSLDLTKYGDLVLEDSFRYFSGRNTSSTFRGRADRYVFLFQRLYLVTKREEDGYQYKTHLEMKDLQLTERVQKEPNSYQIRQVSTGRSFTFQARNEQHKTEWVQKVKFQLVESIPHLPDKAKLLIMRGFEVPRDLGSSRERTCSNSQTTDKENVSCSRKTHSLERNTSSHIQSVRPSPISSTIPEVTQTEDENEVSPSVRTGSFISSLVSSIHNPSSFKFDSALDQEVGSERDDLSDIHSISSSPSVKSNMSSEDFASSHVSPDSGGSDRSWDSGTSKNSEATQPNSLAMPTLFSNCHSRVHDSSETSELDLSESVSSVVPHLSEDTDDHTHGKDSSNTMKEETLFDELMASSSTVDVEVCPGADEADSAASFTFTNQIVDMPTDFTCSHASVNSDTWTQSSYVGRSGSFDESSTPRASPYTSPSGIRRWSVKKRRSYDRSDPDEVATPKIYAYRRRSSSEPDHVVFSPVLDPQMNTHQPIILKNLRSCPDIGLERSEQDQAHVEAMHPDCRDVDAPESSLLGGEEIPNSRALLRSPDLEVEGGLATSALQPGIPFHSSITIPQFHSTIEYRSHSFSKKSRSSSFSNLVRRSHSFGSTLRHIIHRRESSRSSENSPLPSPKFKSKHERSPNSTSNVKNRQRHKKKGWTPPLSAKKGCTPPLSTKKGSTPPSSAITCSTEGQSIKPSTLSIPHIHIDPLVTVDFENFPSSPGVTSLHSVVLPPPAEFNGSSDCLETALSQASSTGRGEDEPGGRERENSSIISFFRKHKRGSRSSTPGDTIREDKREEWDCAETAIKPKALEGTDEISSSNDMYSFDEVLASYDRYASETGLTARSSRQASEVSLVMLASSPSSFSTQVRRKKKSKKAKKRHGYTVDNIDSEIIKQVRLNLTENELRVSHVQQLAREYSQRIKERSQHFKRHSTVLEVSREEAEDMSYMSDPSRPEWLSQLGVRNRRASTDRILVARDLGGEQMEAHRQRDAFSDQLKVENGAQTGQKRSMSRVDQREWEEAVKSSKLKGWVRSLVSKFGKKET